MPSELSTISWVCSALAVMPSTQFTRRLVTARSMVAIEAKSAKVITGSMTFNCSCPAEAARVTVRSRPITRKLVWFTTSGITGFTLPGMIEEPGCICGRLISLKPQRGPEASSRRSLQILVSLDEVRLAHPRAGRRRR